MREAEVMLTVSNGGQRGPREQQGEGDRVGVGILGKELDLDRDIDLALDHCGPGHNRGHVAYGDQEQRDGGDSHHENQPKTRGEETNP